MTFTLSLFIHSIHRRGLRIKVTGSMNTPRNPPEREVSHVPIKPRSWNCGSHDMRRHPGLPGICHNTIRRLCQRFSCLIITPFGAPVLPDVYCRKAISEGSTPTSRRFEERESGSFLVSSTIVPSLIFLTLFDAASLFVPTAALCICISLGHSVLESELTAKAARMAHIYFFELRAIVHPLSSQMSRVFGMVSERLDGSGGNVGTAITPFRIHAIKVTIKSIEGGKRRRALSPFCIFHLYRIRSDTA